MDMIGRIRRFRSRKSKSVHECLLQRRPCHQGPLVHHGRRELDCAGDVAVLVILRRSHVDDECAVRELLHLDCRRMKSATEGLDPQ